MDDKPTIVFRITEEKNRKISETMQSVYVALQERGYNPIDQIAGYIVSGDPTYITSHNNARADICKFRCDELLQFLLDYYFNEKGNAPL